MFVFSRIFDIKVWFVCEDISFCLELDLELVRRFLVIIDFVNEFYLKIDCLLEFKI